MPQRIALGICRSFGSRCYPLGKLAHTGRGLCEAMDGLAHDGAWLLQRLLLPTSKELRPTGRMFHRLPSGAAPRCRVLARGVNQFSCLWRGQGFRFC